MNSPIQQYEEVQAMKVRAPQQVNVTGRRSEDGPSHNDDMRESGWFFVGYIALIVVGIFLLTPFGHHVMRVIWGLA